MTEQPITPNTGEEAGASTPAPTPIPAKPTPGRMPSPAAMAQKPAASLKPILPVVTAADQSKIDEAKAFGRVDDATGAVFLLAEPEVEVGKVADAGSENALEFFAKRYLDVLAQVDALDVVLVTDPPQVREVRRGVDKISNALSTINFVGDLAGLQARAQEQQVKARQIISEVDRARKVDKQKATEEREALVVSAESLSQADAASINWRQAGDQFREFLDTWKAHQGREIKLDKGVEDSLWKRFSHARANFDRVRKHHFSELDATHAQAKVVKEQLITEAEKLSQSTDWNDTTAKFRTLMDKWRNSGRASRKDDDALWARFKGAQDIFFAAKSAEYNAVESEFQQNLVVKEALLNEAKTILPIKDLAAAKEALRSVQDRWEEAGKVPRADVRRIEDGLRSIERAIKDAEDDEWRRTNPETQARTSGFKSQLETLISDLEADLAKAQASGNAKKIKDIEANLQARREWLATLG